MSDCEESPETEETTYEPEAIVDYKKSSASGAGGYKLQVKWVGYDDSENTWEKMDKFVNEYDCKREDIYTLLSDYKIKLYGIEGKLNLITGTEIKHKHDQTIHSDLYCRDV